MKLSTKYVQGYSKQRIDDLADESEIPQRPLSQNINSLEKQTALCANHSEVFFLFKNDFQGQPTQLFSHTCRKVIQFER